MLTLWTDEVYGYKNSFWSDSNGEFPWVAAARRAEISARAAAIRDKVRYKEIRPSEGEDLFLKLEDEIAALAAKTDPGPGHERGSWARHWRMVRHHLESVRRSMRFHADGGANARVTWKHERRLMLGAMEWAVATGVTRISKTSGEPVFTDKTPAAHIISGGCALSRDKGKARRQMAAAGLDW